MVAVFVTFRYGKEFSEAMIRGLAEGARASFEGMPGLLLKVFSVQAELREARNVYVWHGMEAGRGFFTPEKCARIAELYGVPPDIEYAEVGALVRNPQG